LAAIAKTKSKEERISKIFLVENLGIGGLHCKLKAK
jgi:hypothetical protein